MSTAGFGAQGGWAVSGGEADGGGGPVPGQEPIEIPDTMIVDAGEDIGEPSLRIDVVEARGLDQGVDHGGAVAAAVGACEQPCLAAERNAAQGPLGGIVGEADTPIVEEAREGSPALQHIGHRLGDVGMPRQPGPLGPHPLVEIGDEPSKPLAADREPLRGRQTIDLALDGEDRVDTFDRFDSQRRDRRQLAAGLGGDVGQDEELAPGVRPARRLDQGSRPAVSRVEPIEAGIGVRLQDPDIAIEVTFGMFARPIA